MTRILLTGGSGLVGRRLMQRLAGDGHLTTVALRSAADDYVRRLADRICAVEGCGPRTDWRLALEGCSTVIHLAAQVPARGVSEHVFDETNNQGTARLVEQARDAGVERFIFLSSIFALTDNSSPAPIDDSSVSIATSAYGRSKLAAEKHVTAFAGHGTAVSLRPPLIYAGEAKGNWYLLQKLAATGLPLPLALADNRRSFLSIDNLVDAIVKVTVAERENSLSGSFAVADGKPASLADVIRWLRAGMGKSARLLPVPPKLLEIGLKLAGKGQLAPSLLGDLQIDAARFREVYAWQPTLTSQEGMMRSGADFLRQGLQHSSIDQGASQ